MQLGSAHGRQAPCPLSLSGVQQRAQRLRPRPALPLRLAGERQGRPGRGLPQQTRAETGFGLTRQAGREWLQGLLSRFGPMNDKASNAYVLDFEKPLVELDNRIKEVGAAAAWQARMLKIRCQKKLVVKLVVRRTAH